MTDDLQTKIAWAYEQLNAAMTQLEKLGEVSNINFVYKIPNEYGFRIIKLYSEAEVLRLR